MASQHPRDTEPMKWLTAENMILEICLKVALSRSDPAVAIEVSRALTGVQEMPAGPSKDFAQIVCADLMARLFPHRAGEIE